ncbi:MAG: hypothetical protein ACRC9M_00870, partial [Aeromonas sp.]
MTTKDTFGNTSTATDTEGYEVDLVAPTAPKVIIVDDLNHDGILTRAEIGADQVLVQALVNNSDLVEGGKVTLTINNGGVISSVDLTLKADGTLDSSDGKNYSYNSDGTISWTEPTPADSKSLTVTATQTDLVGQVSPEGSDTAQVIIPDAPIVSTDPYEVLAAINFEDIALPSNIHGGSWRDDVNLNDVSGASTIGTWHANGNGLVEVGLADTYGTNPFADGNTHVLEIEGGTGVNAIYTDIQLDSGLFYDLSFDVGARAANFAICGLVVSLIEIDSWNGEPKPGTEKVLYDFDPTAPGWLLDQNMTFGVDASSTYRLQFESKDLGDSYGALLDNIVFNKHENKGYIDELFDISSIVASLVDNDGSETLQVFISGLPDDTQIYDGITSYDVNAGQKLDITNLNLDDLGIVLSQAGNYNVTIEAVAKETATGETASTTTDFTIEVLPALRTSVQANEADDTTQHDDGALSAVSSDDNVDDHSALAPSGGDHSSDTAMNTVHAGLGEHILCGTQGADLFVWGQQEKPT